MRLTQTVLAFAAAASLTLSPAYADSHGNKPATAGKPTTGGKPATSGKSSGRTSTSTSTTTTPLNPVAAKISAHPQLKAKITAMLPKSADGTPQMTLNQASLGFKNQGQFIAALHVSQNLNISFTDLRKQMITTVTATQGGQTTTTATQTKSLGQAIQYVKKNADATAEAQKAQTQANQDLGGTSTTTTTAKNAKKKTSHAGGAQ